MLIFGLKRGWYGAAGACNALPDVRGRARFGELLFASCMGGRGVDEGPYGLSRLSTKLRLIGDVMGGIASDGTSGALWGNKEGWNSTPP